MRVEKERGRKTYKRMGNGGRDGKKRLQYELEDLQ